jgi:hypothetical protein
MVSSRNKVYTLFIYTAEGIDVPSAVVFEHTKNLKSRKRLQKKKAFAFGYVN